MDRNLAEKRVAVLGAGKMGGILVKALLEKKLLSPKLTTATVGHEERASALAKKPDTVSAMRPNHIERIFINSRMTSIHDASS